MMNEGKPKLELLYEDRKTINQSILVDKIYDNAILRTCGCRYVKIYKILDINYELSDDKSVIDKAYKNFINNIDKNVEVSIIVNSKKLGKKFIEDKVIIKLKNDKYDYLREGINETIRKNSSVDTLIKEKYLVVAIDGGDYDNEDSVLSRMNLIILAIKRNFVSISNARLRDLSIDEIYKLLYSFYNKDREDDKLSNKEFDLISENTRKSLDIDVRELIKPKSMSFYKDYFMLNDKFVVALHLYDVNKNVNTDVFDKLTNNDFEVVLTFKERPIDPIKTNELIENEMGNIDSDIYDVEKSLSEDEVSTNLVPQNMKLRQEEAIEINKSIKVDNDYLFDMGLYALVYGDSYEKVYDNVYTFTNNALLVGLSFEVSEELQENIFNTILPYGINQTLYTRCITSEGITAFMPFSSMDLIEDNGDYFGRNLITNNPITHNIMHADNYSSMIFGMSGKGKSFNKKQTFLSRNLRHEDRNAVLIDPSGEDDEIIKLVDGETVFVEAGGIHHINIFDIDANYGKNPLADKEDFILSMCSLMLNKTLSAGQKTTASRAIQEIYKNRHWKEDASDVPTIIDFEKALSDVVEKEREAEDLELLKAIKYYSSTSSCTLFRGKTNIDLSKRVISYNLINLGSTLKPLAMQVILDYIWMQIYKNKIKKRPTDVIIDELHLMFQEKETAKYMSKYWKMLRKNLGCPMGVTQNPEDVLNSIDGREVILNSGLLVSLSLQDEAAMELKRIIRLTDKEVNYIMNKDSGTGLIYVHSTKGKGTKIVVPFDNNYDKDNIIYKLFDTSSEAK